MIDDIDSPCRVNSRKTGIRRAFQLFPKKHTAAGRGAKDRQHKLPYVLSFGNHLIPHRLWRNSGFYANCFKMRLQAISGKKLST
jgi:hypothetical protein